MFIVIKRLIMNVKYEEGTRVIATFCYQKVSTSKEYFNKWKECEGVVKWDDETQSFYVESIEKLPVIGHRDNGLMGTYRAHKAKSWYVQDYAIVKCSISDIKNVL